MKLHLYIVIRSIEVSFRTLGIHKAKDEALALF